MVEVDDRRMLRSAVATLLCAFVRDARGLALSFVLRDACPVLIFVPFVPIFGILTLLCLSQIVVFVRHQSSRRALIMPQTLRPIQTTVIGPRRRRLDQLVPTVHQVIAARHIVRRITDHPPIATLSGPRFTDPDHPSLQTLPPPRFKDPGSCEVSRVFPLV